LADGVFPQVAPRLLAGDPLEPQGLPHTIVVNAEPFDGRGIGAATDAGPVIPLQTGGGRLHGSHSLSPGRTGHPAALGCARWPSPLCDRLYLHRRLSDPAEQVTS